MGGNGSIRIAVNGNELSQVIPFVASSFTWFQIPRFYDLGEGRHRLTIEFPNSNILLDQIAFTSGPADFDLFLNVNKGFFYCVCFNLAKSQSR